jgi:hypothetical protein
MLLLIAVHETEERRTIYCCFPFNAFFSFAKGTPCITPEIPR